MIPSSCCLSKRAGESSSRVLDGTESWFKSSQWLGSGSGASVLLQESGREQTGSRLWSHAPPSGARGAFWGQLRASAVKWETTDITALLFFCVCFVFFHPHQLAAPFSISVFSGQQFKCWGSLSSTHRPVLENVFIVYTSRGSVNVSDLSWEQWTKDEAEWVDHINMYS